MTPLPFGTKSGLTVFVLALCFYATFTMGSLLGANAAINDSVSYDHVEQNISQIEPDVKADLQNDTSGIADQFIDSTVMTWTKGALTSAQWGAQFGYTNPTLARLHGKVAHYLMIGGVGVLVVRRVRRLWYEIE